MKESASPPYAKFVWSWNGRKYDLPVSAKDVLVWARAVDAEGYPEIGVAWALLQRAAWLKVQGKAISLGSLVEQYAQPINPAWFPQGAKHLAEMERLLSTGDTQAASSEEARATARVKLANKEWSEISADTKRVLMSIISGQSRTPVVGAVHYWASRGPDFISNQARKPELILLDRGYGFGPGRNVFFADKGSTRFGANITPEGGRPSLAGLADIGPLMVMTLLGVVTWKWLS